VAVQFHPEFKSKPLKPHPLFAGFVEASHRHKTAARSRRAAAGVESGAANTAAALDGTPW
jgi:CTP synthase